ncbi:MAG TPA: hypothetical protein VEI02_03355, partial [Planctomycetota bacterium]|nr:hypothetical protein [Planctomycetota bacterium]
MATRTVDGRDDELRRTLLFGLADLWDALLRGPAPKVGIFVAVVALELVLASTLKTRVLGSRRCRVEPAAVAAEGFPPYVPRDVCEALRRPPGIAARSIADPALESDVRRAYESHPWVRRVTRVRRLYPSRVGVDMELRRPFALVEAAAWRLVVDAEGVVLEDRSSRAPEGLPVVRADARTAPRIPHLGR